MSRRGQVLFVAMGVIWGLPYLLVRVAVRQLSPAELAFFRPAVAALTLAPYVLRRYRVRELCGYLVALFVYSAVEIALPWLLLFRAEQRLPSSVAGLLVSLSPVFAVALTRATRHEGPLRPARLVGLGLGLGGTASLVGLDVRGAGLIGVAEVVGVAFCYGLGSYLIARYLVPVPAPLVVLASLVITSLLYAPWALTHLPKVVGAETYESVAVLALVCTNLGFVLFFALIAEIGPARATVITFMNTAIAVVLGIVFLNEPFSLGIGVGFPLILLGSYLATRQNHRGAVPARPLSRSG